MNIAGSCIFLAGNLLDDRALYLTRLELFILLSEATTNNKIGTSVLLHVQGWGGVVQKEQKKFNAALTFLDGFFSRIALHSKSLIIVSHKIILLHLFMHKSPSSKK